MDRKAEDLCIQVVDCICKVADEVAICIKIVKAVVADYHITLIEIRKRNNLSFRMEDLNNGQVYI